MFRYMLVVVVGVVVAVYGDESFVEGTLKILFTGHIGTKGPRFSSSLSDEKSQNKDATSWTRLQKPKAMRNSRVCNHTRHLHDTEHDQGQYANAI
jgi:hypothetical protein